jgi:hypothetical protein
MGETPGEREWLRGYEAARSHCLAKGAESALSQKPLVASVAYEAGYDWGLWDYEDANGLPHRRERGA